MPAVAPDLAVEVLSAGNTNREMERKLDDYFAAGVQLAWFIEPMSQRITVYEGRERSEEHYQSETRWTAAAFCPVLSCRSSSYSTKRDHTDYLRRKQ